jgi:E3 ubiquitin-protein ligase HOS1
VIQRKAYAEERKWPRFSDKGSDINEANQSTLFIEQALQNLGIEQNYRDKEEDITITCLQNEQSSSMFCSTITTDHCSIDRYPFKNLREAVDVLFLHGASDMVIAKQAIVSFSFFILSCTTFGLFYLSLGISCLYCSSQACYCIKFP